MTTTMTEQSPLLRYIESLSSSQLDKVEHAAKAALSKARTASDISTEHAILAAVREVRSARRDRDDD